jgi:predicted chitinase
VLGIDLVNHPELALEPRTSARLLALFFADHTIRELADAGKWRAIRLAVNGGTNGLDHFLQLVDALEAL